MGTWMSSGINYSFLFFIFLVFGFSFLARVFMLNKVQFQKQDDLYLYIRDTTSREVHNCFPLFYY